MLSALSWASFLSYSVALGLLWQYTTRPQRHTHFMRSSIVIMTLIGLIFHGIELYIRILNYHVANPDAFYALGHSISMVALFVTALFVLASMARAMINLGLAILPTTLLGLLAGRWLNPDNQIGINLQAGFEWHFALGIITFSVLSLTFAQSLLIIVQENQLRDHSRPASAVSLVSLPALQSMETLLFQLLWLGFIVLSLTLGSGFLANNAQYGTPLVFNHHTLLTLLTWLGYCILLGGRTFLFWRGRQAAFYTIICYSLFLLGYFGPRIVKELIIN